MKRDLALWQFAAYVFAVLFGTILHFIYDWTGQCAVVAPFAAINESTWEHMKLLFMPMFAFALIQRRFFADVPSFWCIKLGGTLIGILMIPVLFYTYNGVFGTSSAFVNIAIFFIAAAIAVAWETHAFRRAVLPCPFPAAALAILCLIGALFVAFTFYPPQIPLFKSPV